MLGCKAHSALHDRASRQADGLGTPHTLGRMVKFEPAADAPSDFLEGWDCTPTRGYIHVCWLERTSGMAHIATKDSECGTSTFSPSKCSFSPWERQILQARKLDSFRFGMPSGQRFQDKVDNVRLGLIDALRFSVRPHVMDMFWTVSDNAFGIFWATPWVSDLEPASYNMYGAAQVALAGLQRIFGASSRAIVFFFEENNRTKAGGSAISDAADAISSAEGSAVSNAADAIASAEGSAISEFARTLEMALQHNPSFPPHNVNCASMVNVVSRERFTNMSRHAVAVFGTPVPAIHLARVITRLGSELLTEPEAQSNLYCVWSATPSLFGSTPGLSTWPPTPVSETAAATYSNAHP